VNWEAIGAIGEIIGATAVVATLIYLAIQIRHSTRETQALGIQAAASLDQEFLIAVGADPATAQLWATFLYNPDELSDAQKLQGVYLLASLLRRFENVLLQKQLGTLSEEGWRSRQPMMCGIANSAGYALFLEYPPAKFFTEDFRAHMAGLIDES